MTNKQLAKMIVDFIPFWELAYTEYKDNYQTTLKSLESREGLQATYDYLYSEDETGITYNTIINELKMRLNDFDKKGAN